MKTFFWLIAVCAASAVGFYLGIGYGAQSISRIAAQNQVADGLSRVRLSLDAIKSSDVARSQELLENSLKSALFQIGSSVQDSGHGQCTEKELEAIQAANQYARSKPELLNGPWQSIIAKGQEVCTDEVRTQSSDA